MSHDIALLIPAHNEEACIADAINGARDQFIAPRRIIVVADNCTDRTVEIARAMGVEVLITEGNTAKKAGALNQAIERLDLLAQHDYLFVQDADSVIDRRFLAVAVHRMLKEPTLGGCGGTFTGRDGGGLVGMFQRSEYARYKRQTRQRAGKVLVLTGTATLLRTSALRDLIAARVAGRLPGAVGKVYDERVLTEDNELSLALMHLGWKIVSPGACILTTEVMETWGDLARQRLRWKRGAIENLRDYGLTRITAPYWGRQLLSFVGILVMIYYLATVTWALTHGGLQLQPLWLIVTAIFMAERVLSVRSRGPLHMLVAATLIIEMTFDIFLQAVHLRAIAQTVFNTERTW